ncbi:FAD-dependent oxidoreductase [Streptomyces sp. NBUA17]|uniref:FAD-dependent oxidoreductase n=1 Tax=Streptomyces sp. NBUA17 TaxID=3062275 RepID=UPI0037DA1738
MTRNDATPALPASTPPDRCDLLVVGLGPLGAHTLREAALRGLDVVGVEQQAEIGHEEGAAGGHTRIFRLAYKEGPAYVPALRESLDVWRDLATQIANAPHGDAEPLLHPGGVLTVGAPDHPDLRATVEAARGLVDLEVVPAGRWPAAGRSTCSAPATSACTTRRGWCCGRPPPCAPPWPPAAPPAPPC